MTSNSYVARPVRIDAIQWLGYNLTEIQDFAPNKTRYDQAKKKLFIDTMEGTMEAKNRDYIIRGTKGEYYPCDEEVFLNKYTEELAHDEYTDTMNRLYHTVNMVMNNIKPKLFRNGYIMSDASWNELNKVLTQISMIKHGN